MKKIHNLTIMGNWRQGIQCLIQIASSYLSQVSLLLASKPRNNKEVMTIDKALNPFLFYCLTPDDFIHQGGPLGGNELTGSICPSLSLNPFPPKTGPFVILLSKKRLSLDK